jgi:OMF family outer membrane factor
LQLEVTREDLRLNVARAYYSLQQGDESVRINLAAVRNAETSLRDAQALERAGLGTRFDVLRAEVQLANARQDLTESLAQQEIRRRQLAQLLNLPLTISLAAGDPVSLAGSWDLSLEQSLILALKNRAELEQLLAQRELSEQQRRAALSAYGPTVTLSASYEFATQFNDDLGTRDGYRLAAGVNWNLFDGGAALAQARQQEANIAIAETNFTNQRNQIRFEVEQAYYTLVSNLESIDTATRALAQANEALRLARLRFQAGVGTQTDVINAETELTRAEGNRVNAILGYNQALAELQRAISNFRVAPVAGTPIAPTTPTVPPTVPEAAPTPPETPVPTTPEATPAVPTTPAPTPAVPTTPEPTPATPTAPEAVPAVPETPVPTTPEPTPGTPEPTTPPVPAPEPTP